MPRERAGELDPAADDPLSALDSGVQHVDADPGAPPELGPPALATPRPGWTVRGTLPYPRLGHAAVLDTDRDRMLVFGGGANDLWSFELSGEHKHTWSQLAANGPFPPAHRYALLGSMSSPDAAVYVPERRSMIVVLNPLSAVTERVARTEVWELSLAAAPTWSRLTALEGSEGGAEIQGASAAYDARGKRLLVLGGTSQESGLWSLSLTTDREPQWSRLADGPPMEGHFFSGHALRFDPARNRVILIGGVPRSLPVLALELDREDAEWVEIDPGTNATSSYGPAVAIDVEHDALVVIGGDQTIDGASTLSFETGLWTSRSAPRSFDGASAVLDRARDRLIVFGGMDEGYALTNETWAYDLGSHEWSRLGQATERTAPRADFGVVYDPEREAVIAFGNHSSPSTLEYALGPDADPLEPWRRLPIAGTPAVSYGMAIYDPGGLGVVAFGGYRFRESDQLAHLPSADGTWWEAITVEGDRPSARSGHAMVYDSLEQRAIVFGGSSDTSYPPQSDYDDAWALSLDGTPAWTRLAVSGSGPHAGAAGHAIYDPGDHRVVVLQDGRVYTLALGDELHWSHIETSGDGPWLVASGAALYQPGEDRMIVLDHEDTGTQVYALDLGTWRWRRYCPETLTPAPPLDAPRVGNAVLVPDGIFMVFNSAAYRFDLATPFCD